MRWTEEEDEVLHTLWQEGYTAREIALRLKRTPAATKARIHAKGLKKNKNWTTEEKQRLLQLRHEGTPTKKLARLFGCSEKAVSSMLAFLRSNTDAGKNSA